MITLLIGHRGTGKTSFLRSLKALHPELTCLDLDEEVARDQAQSIEEIFKKGEDFFRQCERACLAKLLEKIKPPAVIALGAGFEGPLPSQARVVWLRRATDASARSFRNRPRLNPEISPVEEYLERFFARDRRFADWAHEQISIPEGSSAGLEKLLDGKIDLPFDITLLPEDFREWQRFLAKRHRRRFELRDDLLSPAQIEIARRDIPASNLLFSRRLAQGEAPRGVPLDWPLELGEPPTDAKFISLHEREDDFASTLQRLSAYDGYQLKLAVEVQDFTELKFGHEWQMQDPERRSFLPRSPNGRWRWYRSLFGPRMPLHFIREGTGSGLDQPLLWQARMQPPLKTYFAAVLGQPVEHSRSPQEHWEFFKARAMPFVAIDLPEAEFTFALQFLQELGLKSAAVTAPLKKLAWAQAHVLSSEARKTQAANSLHFVNGKIFAHNTDLLALQTIRTELADYKSVWLWGGGGVKSSVAQVWPELSPISARQGTADRESPDLLIWATGRSRPFVWPAVRPKLVLDLNYSDDSPGLEWAVRENLPYQSGLRMFKLQAELQRQFWQACEQGVWF